MSRLSVKMQSLVQDNSDEFIIKRTVNNSDNISPDGEFIPNQEISLSTRFLVTTLRKEDYQQLNIGNTSRQIVKVRQMKSEPIQLQLGDRFDFLGMNFKIYKPKLYMPHFADFNSYYAITEADVFD